MKRSWVEFLFFVVCFLPSELSKHFPSVSLFSLIFSVGFSFYFFCNFLLSLNPLSLFTPLSLSFSQDLLLFLIIFLFFLMFLDFSCFVYPFVWFFLTFVIYFLLFLLVFLNFYTDLIFSVPPFFYGLNTPLHSMISQIFFFHF